MASTDDIRRQSTAGGLPLFGGTARLRRPLTNIPAAHATLLQVDGVVQIQFVKRPSQMIASCQGKSKINLFNGSGVRFEFMYCHRLDIDFRLGVRKNIFKICRLYYQLKRAGRPIRPKLRSVATIYLLNENRINQFVL